MSIHPRQDYEPLQLPRRQTVEAQAIHHPEISKSWQGITRLKENVVCCEDKKID